MARSAATTVEQYLAELPEDRRGIVAKIREFVRANLPEGYKEAMNWGMISYEVPLSRYPKTYNKQPLCFAAIAAQKNYYVLHLMCLAGSPDQEGSLRQAFERAGKKLDIGKACIRFQSPEDLVLDPLARVIASTPVDAFIARYEASRRKP
jgi:uncharacterized protein YdhG (YjbR/CyaY superfamily)